MGKLALITGANGMDAKTLARFLSKKGYDIVLTHRRNSLFNTADWLEETQIKNKENIFFEPCDITDQNSVRICIKNVLECHGKIDEIYMLAAMSHVGSSFSQKEYCIQANGQSYYYFLEAVKDLTPKTKVYGALTSELFGGIGSGVFNEESLWHPKSPYAIGKALGGHWIKYYRESKEDGLFCCFGTLFNHSNFFRSRDFFVAKVCKAAADISQGSVKSVKLGNLSFFRDEHWTDYGVEMMWKMLQNESPKDYVIGTNETHCGEEYLDNAFKYFNLDWEKYVEFDENLVRPNEVDVLTSDSRLAEKELGWNPKRLSFEDHIGRLCLFHDAKNKGEKIDLDKFN